MLCKIWKYISVNIETNRKQQILVSQPYMVIENNCMPCYSGVNMAGVCNQL